MFIMTQLTGCSNKFNAGEIYENNKSCIGKISTDKSNGSGFVIDGKDGLIITNYHVIEAASKIFYITDSNNTYESKGIVFASKELDISIIKVDAVITSEVILETENESKIGEKIFAISSPLGEYVNTLSEGIISSIRLIDGNSYYQHNASITNGSSGGALFNEFGNVIGIVNMGVDETDINFAIIINSEILSIINKYKDMDTLELNNNILNINDFANRDGDIIDGKFKGEVKEFYTSGEIKYIGSIVNGKLDGKGKIFNKNGQIVYNGEFKEGKANGIGSLYGYTSAFSKATFQYVIYEGSFIKGSYEGTGKEYYNYNFMIDTYNSPGLDLSIRYRTGSIKKSEITENQWKLIYEYMIDVKQININDLDEDVIKKYGISYIKPGRTDNGRLKYEGTYKNGLFEGEGKLFNKAGELIYEGGFKEGNFHGYGTEYDINLKVKYFGKWQNGERLLIK